MSQKVYKQIDQLKDPKEFFEEFKFTTTYSLPHPEYNGPYMTFTGLEARYVQSLERQVKDLEKYINMQNEKLDWLRDREFYCWKEGKREKS